MPVAAESKGLPAPWYLDHGTRALWILCRNMALYTTSNLDHGRLRRDDGWHWIANLAMYRVYH